MDKIFSDYLNKPLPFGVRHGSFKLQEMGIDPGILLRDILRQLKKKKPDEIDMNQVWAGVLWISKKSGIMKKQMFPG